MTIKKAYKAEPVAILAGAGIVGNGVLHPILQAASMSPTAHTLIHGGIVSCLAIAGRQSVFAPKTVEQIEAEAKAKPPRAGV